jgi:NADH:ubiquinone oxidoreductase subunit 3 (subunit A)
MAVTAVFVVLVAISILMFVIAAALRKARDEQAKLSNYTAAQSLQLS